MCRVPEGHQWCSSGKCLSLGCPLTEITATSAAILSIDGHTMPTQLRLCRRWMRRRPEQQHLCNWGFGLHAAVQLHHICHHPCISCHSVRQWRSRVSSCGSYHLQCASGANTSPSVLLPECVTMSSVSLLSARKGVQFQSAIVQIRSARVLAAMLRLVLCKKSFTRCAGDAWRQGDLLAVSRRIPTGDPHQSLLLHEAACNSLHMTKDKLLGSPEACNSKTL